jgi:CRISPR-associated protein Csh1
LEKLYVLNDNFKEQLGKHIFNFYTLYKFIPVREGTNNNIALEFFSNLFQQRPIEKSQLFQSFNQYIRCQRSGQFDNKGFHNSYSNIYQNNSFDFAIKNAVTMYSAFFMLLDELNLLKSANTMENNTTTMTNQERSQKINEQIEEFFDKMKYNESQKALFYLGRVLNTIAYAQYQKGHTSKPIMNKINYNGMDRDDIRRLRIDLEEKANQYDILEKTQFNFSKFTDYFDYNQWNIDPEEAVFFILAGYSFFISND